MKFIITSILLLMSVNLANAATYQVTVNDADVPLLNAFLLGTANTSQGQVGTTTNLIGTAPAIPLTPAQYFTALVENFMAGLREEAKRKQIEASIKRLESITPQEKAFIVAYDNLPPKVKEQLIKSVVMPSVAGHRGNHEHFDSVTGKSQGMFSDGN